MSAASALGPAYWLWAYKFEGWQLPARLPEPPAQATSEITVHTRDFEFAPIPQQTEFVVAPKASLQIRLFYGQQRVVSGSLRSRVQKVNLAEGQYRLHVPLRTEPGSRRVALTIDVSE